MTTFALPCRVVRHLILPVLLGLPGAAHADEADNRVDLVCNAGANLALVRFAISEEAQPTYPRLPQALDHGLSAATGSGRTDCTLANGTTIRLRGGAGQAFAYGAGGGDPPAFFSLWINQRKQFARRVWKPGYADAASNLPIYDGVLIAGNSITICATTAGKRQTCTRQPFDLAKAPIDRAEYGPNAHKRVQGHMAIIAKGEVNQRFCIAYRDQIEPGIDSATRGEPTSLDIDLAKVARETSRDAPEARSGMVELAPGITRRMMVWQGDNHYFDGAAVVLAPANMAMQNVNAVFPFDTIEQWPTHPAPAGWTLISGGQKQLYPAVSPRYVHLVPQTLDGQLYFLAYPTNTSVRPTAALVKPLPEGGFATLCAFNRTEAHY